MCTDGPSISVVIPAYNSADSIGTAIESAQKQTYAPLEILVVDDGSADDTVDVVRALTEQDTTVRLIRQENAGPAAARNRAIRESRGDWIAFLDADDRWLPERLRRQIELVQRHPSLQWITGSHYLATNACLANASTLSPRVNGFDDPIYSALEMLAWDHSVWTGAVLVSRALLTEVGLFDEALIGTEDSDLWVRLALRRGEIGYVSTPIAVYNVAQSNSLTVDALRKLEMSRLTFFERLEKYSKETNDSVSKQRLSDILIKHIDSYANGLVHAGESRMARHLIRELRARGLPLPSFNLRLASLLPEPISSNVPGRYTCLLGGWCVSIDPNLDVQRHGNRRTYSSSNNRIDDVVTQPSEHALPQRGAPVPCDRFDRLRLLVFCADPT